METREFNKIINNLPTDIEFDLDWVWHGMTKYLDGPIEILSNEYVITAHINGYKDYKEIISIDWHAEPEFKLTKNVINVEDVFVAKEDEQGYLEDKEHLTGDQYIVLQKEIEKII